MSGQIKTQQTQRHQDVDGDVRSADVQKDDGFVDLEDPLGETMIDPMLAEAEIDTAELDPPSAAALGLLVGSSSRAPLEPTSLHLRGLCSLAARLPAHLAPAPAGKTA